MFFKNLKLTNFRNLEDLEISFVKENGDIRELSLLLGENGTGKSGILKAIGIITAGSSALGNILGDPDSWVQNGKKYCEIQATLVTKSKQERNLSLRINRGDHLREVIKRGYETLEEIDNALEHTERNYFILGYGASRRLSNASSRKGSVLPGWSDVYRYDNVATIFDPNAILSPLESWAMDLEYQHGRQGLATVKSVLSEFLGDVRFHRIDKKQKQLLFKTPYGIVPLSSLSDGYQNVAAWIGDLLYRITTTFDDYKNPLNTRGVLLIDEVDLHLHPKWQRRLLDFLKDKLESFQIIATTHSPLTAQQAEEGELLILTKNPDNKLSANPLLVTPANFTSINCLPLSCLDLVPLDLQKWKPF